MRERSEEDRAETCPRSPHCRSCRRQLVAPFNGLRGSCARTLTRVPCVFHVDLPVVPICRTRIACVVGQITGFSLSHPAPLEGRIAIVKDVGCGERWTRAASQDECGCRGRRRRVVPISRRWDQVSQTMVREATVAIKPGHRGERAAAVKTVAPGMPVVPAEPVVPAACYFCCRRAMGAASIRHSLRPPYFEGDA